MASVDDLEELIATRKLNGLNDNLYIDGNDTNVGSIENLKILLFQDNLTQYGKRKLIEYYEKKIKELKEENQRLKAKIDVVNWQEKTAYQCLKEKYIPKQKITDFKEQIKLEPVIVGGRRNKKTLEYGIKLGKIKACEELLKQEETDEKI